MVANPDVAAKCVPEGVTEKDLILVAGKAKLDDYINVRLTIPFDGAVDDNIFNTEERRAKNVYRHPNYTDGQNHDNIALIELKTPFTDKVPLLKISPDKNDRHDDCTVLGWGATQIAYNNVNLMYANNIKDVTKGICVGDTGGSLVCADVAWGVASHFLPETVLISCGRNSEQYYTEIHPYKSWLDLYLPNASSPLNLSGTVLITTFMCWFVNTFGNSNF
ncbi:hypothetical protein RUM44_009554 [Polyplax serrata]|uniref:Peptidase S1 domain-containing protein n=1 Tax=Polyplax serrata TaxID=468196 RepID=A0ABR1AUQ9_POLSC